ncbi:MAG: hypothetical protein E7478_07125 [Ruminococcaceae bacterium]|nr:hypothetical protein [Oscillospiraceae bacterium]
MENIEDILRALVGEDDDSTDDTAEAASDNGNEQGGLFGSLDPSMLLTMMSLFESLNKPDDGERLLLALKPLLREENQHKVDAAVKFMKIFALLPVLRESGMLGKLF